MINYKKLKIALNLAEKLANVSEDSIGIHIYFQPKKDVFLSATCLDHYDGTTTEFARGYGQIIDKLTHLLDSEIDFIKNKPEPRFKEKQAVWSYIHGEISECTVEAIYWDVDLNDYRVLLLRNGGRNGKISCGQDVVYESRRELMESQICYWGNVFQ